MSRRCFICNGSFTPDRKRAKEHILPLWLLEELCVKDDEVSPTSWYWPSPGIIRERSWNAEEPQVSLKRGPHTLNGFVAGRVCQPCNSDRLNGFESAASQILKRLIRREVKVNELREAEREAVARWLLKTALIFKSYFHHDGDAPLTHRIWLRESETGLPEGVSVFAQLHQATQPFFWFGNAPFQLTAVEGATYDEIEATTLSKEAYNLGLQLGGLLLLVAYWPVRTGWTVSFWTRVHIPLWHRPRVKLGYSLPPGAWPKNDSLRAIVAFSSSLLITKFNRSLETTARQVPIMARSGPVALDYGKYKPVKVSRNASCPCGSGLKYKHCHGKPQAS